MIPAACRRLAEVDFPVAAVSREGAREKSIRRGHPSTLHVWWARRPLASCRAMLLGLLLPDPCDPLCPVEFKERARALLPRAVGRPGPEDADLRRALLDFVALNADWDRTADPNHLAVARGLVAGGAAVFDPFAGAGSIPLEALRLGATVSASDLNPVATLILRTLLETIPREGPALADRVRAAGRGVVGRLRARLAPLYPDEPDGSRAIAWLFARAIRCEACGADLPLLRAHWLCRRRRRRLALVDGAVVETEAPPPGTVQRGRATCPACGAVHEGRAVRAQLRERRGGGRDALLRAVVTTTPGASGRRYRPPAPSDRAALEAARAAFDALPPGALPDEPMNARDPNTVAGRGYGIRAWGDLFTFRQAVTLAALVEEVRAEADPATRACLALALGRMANALTSLSRWHVTGEKLEGAFGRQALPMVWDFAEANPFSGASGGLANAIEWVAAVAEAWPGSPGVARALCADAARLPLDDASQDLLFTDPPYYGAIAYAELSDHFYVWLKRALPGDGLFGGPLTPKDDECIETPHAPGGAKDRAFFEERMERALREARRALRPAGVGCVVFANLGAEGWEAMLTALVRAGWSVSAAWPLVTELPVRNNARDTRALATSLHLVLRPRPEGAPDGSWESIERELPARTAAWRARLAREGVAGLDLACASLVPALALYTAHPRVRDAQGREVPARALVERFIA